MATATRTRKPAARKTATGATVKAVPAPVVTTKPRTRRTKNATVTRDALDAVTYVKASGVAKMRHLPACPHMEGKTEVRKAEAQHMALVPCKACSQIAANRLAADAALVTDSEALLVKADA